MMTKPINCEPLKELVRTVPDFPKPGILFYDITTLLKDKTGFAQLIDALGRILHRQGDRSRAGHRGARLHLRPRARLSSERRLRPGAQAQEAARQTARVSYDLEYGTDSLEIHLDAIQPGQRVIIVDDLLATGGTMQATVQLVRQLGGDIAGLAFAIELDFLKGRDKFKEYDVFSLLHYDE